MSGLAAEGHQRIAWAKAHMPVLHRLLEERLKDGALAGRRVAVVVHLEAKTACLVLALQEAGASVVAAGSNALSTQDAVCDALRDRGVEVHARHGASPDEFTADLLRVAESGAELVIDDGLELTRRMAEHRPDLYANLKRVCARLQRTASCPTRRSPRTMHAASISSTTRTAPGRPRSPRSSRSRTSSQRGVSSASSATATSGEGWRAPPPGSAVTSPWS